MSLLHPAPLPAPPGRAPSEAETLPKPDRSRHHGVVEVLVIEDEVLLAQALAESLESRGFR